MYRIKKQRIKDSALRNRAHYVDNERQHIAVHNMVVQMWKVGCFGVVMILLYDFS